MEMLYAGMNDEFKKFYPQYSLYPKVFEDAYADDIIWANMGGVEGTLDDGLTKFKSNFNPLLKNLLENLTSQSIHSFTNFQTWLTIFANKGEIAINDLS